MLPPLPNPFLNEDSTIRSLNRAHIASLPASLEADDVVGARSRDHPRHVDGNGSPPAAARVRPMAEDFVLHAVTGR